MWKFSLITFIAGFYLSTFVQVTYAKNQLIICLAREEEALIKQHVGGAGQFLNQALINNLIRNDQITLKRQYIQRVCQNPSFSPSLAFLQLILNKEDTIFSFNRTKGIPQNVSYRRLAKQFSDRAAQLFIDYLSHLQLQTPSPDCLTEEFSEIEKLLRRVNALESELGLAKLLHEENRVNKVFDQLKNIDQRLRICERKEKAKQKEIKRSQQQL